MKLPRKPAAVQLLVEREWLPRLASPAPVAGASADRIRRAVGRYPFPWIVCTWVRGIPLVPMNGLRSKTSRASWRTSLQYCSRWTDLVARRSAWTASWAGGAVRPSPRGPRSKVLNLKAAGRIEPDLVDEKRAASLWAAAVDADAWPGPPVWVHRDFGGNS